MKPNLFIERQTLFMNFLSSEFSMLLYGFEVEKEGKMIELIETNAYYVYNRLR